MENAARFPGRRFGYAPSRQRYWKQRLESREFPWAAGHPTPHPIPAARLQQTGKSSGGSVRRGLAGADGRKPGLYVRLGIAVFQAVQTDIPFPTGGKDSGVLDPGAGFYPIPHPPQLAEEGLVGVGLPDGLVHVLTDQVRTVALPCLAASHSAGSPGRPGAHWAQ